MIELSGHTALVTGSTRGVGRAIAEAFARAGADLVLHGEVHDADADDALSACQAIGATCHLVVADLAKPHSASVPPLAAEALTCAPNIDILVNNAGRFYDVPFTDMTVDRFESTFQLNVAAGYFLTQAFALHWIPRNVSGRVLFTGSINGRLAEADSTAYDISKGAVEMMVKTLCVALAPKGIRVNGMAPGLVRTSQTTWIEDQPGMARWMEMHTPNGEVPNPDVCGPAATYLVSDDARHVHGQMLLVDGGMSAWQQPPMPHTGS